MRKWVYGGAAALLILLVIIKAEIIRHRDVAEVPSLTGEWAKHGKPVDAETISLGNIVFRVTITGIVADPIRLVADVPVEIFQRLKTGQPFRSYPDGAITGALEHLSSQTDVTTGLHTVTIHLLAPLKPPHPALLTGTIDVETLSKKLRIPRAAVFTKDSKPFSWVIRNDRVASVPLKLGRSNERFYEVLAGLTPGERVIVRGLTSLIDGDRIRIHNPGDAHD